MFIPVENGHISINSMKMQEIIDSYRVLSSDIVVKIADKTKLS